MASELQDRAVRFAQDVQTLLDDVLPVLPGSDPAARQVNVVLAPDGRFQLQVGPGQRVGRSEDKTKPVALLSDGKHVAGLRIDYFCQLDSANTYLAIHRSSFELLAANERTPLLRADYVRNAAKVPSAHWNVHAERCSLSSLLARANPSHPGLLSKVHLPIGGARYRLCLEDFLQMLIVEFNIDVLPGAMDALAQGRVTWRRYQVATAVRDAPDEAARVLESLGYGITLPEDGHVQPNLEKLQAW